MIEMNNIICMFEKPINDVRQQARNFSLSWKLTQAYDWLYSK